MSPVWSLDESQGSREIWQHKSLFNCGYVHSIFESHLNFQSTHKRHLGACLKPRLHYTWRDATRRDMTRHSSIVHTMRDIVAHRHVAAGDLGSGANKLGNLNGCFDPTWQCVNLTDIPPKITSIRIMQPHKHITWNTNSSHWWVLIKVCWGVNPGCVNSTSHVTLN